MWCLERLLRVRTRPAATSAFAPSTFTNVLTPDSIPEFCIPPRLSPSPSLRPVRDRLQEEGLWPGVVGAREDPDLTDWDPRSQAALSLQHLPRRPTSYGFCALLESPNTRRKESLFLGGSAAAAALLLQPPARQLLRPRAHTYCGGGGGTCNPRGRRGAPHTADAAPSSGSASSSPCHAPRSRSRRRCRRLLRAPEGLLGRALRAGGSRVLARARSVSSAEDDDEDSDAAPDAGRVSNSAGPGAPSPPPPPSALGPPRERPEAESTVTLGHHGGALHLATQYCPASRRLRIRLLRAEGLYSGTAEPGAIGCRVSVTLVPPGKPRKQRSAVIRRSPNPVFNEDFFFDGLSEEDLRRTAVRVKAENKGRGLERDRLLGRAELELSSILL
ncbi:C2 calcium-dependent domain-containing protein 4B-like [Sminthopsis crassicaudata]|uniref:C2 calcium-dependent domain-containing protein 4B-like n=1 Tax=Sminthopsis crassicaudata TaxID=9301 RepID=UPI003D687EFB